jgi:Fe-S-cluster-containing hydrogenase component 2
MLFHMPLCGGCRTCELACGFRHTGAFSHAASSLKVVDREDSHGYSIVLQEQLEGTRPACDGCEGLDAPLCVVYCREAEELQTMVREFVSKVAPPPTRLPGNTST